MKSNPLSASAAIGAVPLYDEHPTTQCARMLLYRMNGSAQFSKLPGKQCSETQWSETPCNYCVIGACCMNDGVCICP